jgi:branched-chain amino acid transport system substrate-binding protein
MAREITKTEIRLIIGLVLIAIIISGGTLLYVTGLAGLPAGMADLSGRVEDLSGRVEELASAERDLASELAKLGTTLGESVAKIEDIEKRLVGVEEVIRGPEAIVVGFSASLTGKFDVYGREGVDALEWWAEEVNKAGGIYVADYDRKLPVKIVYYDDASEKDTALKVVEKLIVEDGAHFIMPSYSSTLTFAEAPITEKYKKTMYGWAAASDYIWEAGFRYVICTITPSSLYEKEALVYLNKHHPEYTKIAIVYKDDPFPAAIAEGTHKMAVEMGYEIVFYDKYPIDVVDVSPLLLRLKPTEPDIIFVECHLKDGMLVAKSMAELDVWAPVMIYGSASAAVPWYDLGPEIAEFTSGSSQWEKWLTLDPKEFPNWYGPTWTSMEWFDMWVERYGYEPDFRAANMFHSALIVQAAIERSGTIMDAERIRRAIIDLDIQTFVAPFKVDPNTLFQLARGNVIIQWINGEKQVVAPDYAATAEWVIPMPK